MIDILFNCFNSFNFYLILFIAFIFFLFIKKSRNEEINKAKEKEIVDSIPRRSEECPQTYPNGWLPVYDSRDLKKGEVKPIFALGRDLVIYRGTSGKVYVFDAYCPHLGANLGVGGNVVGDDIKCHFHGWEFNNQGDCKAIPGLEDKSIPKATIRKWRCDEVNDFIYVWHHLEGKGPDWFMPKLEKLDTLIYRGKYSARPLCHIQDIVENEADLVHFDTIHSTKNLFPKFMQYFIQIETIMEYWKECPPPNTHCTETALVFNLKIFGLTISKISFVFQTIGPAHFSNFTLGNRIIPPLFSTVNIITLGNLKQHLHMKWYSEPSIRVFLLAKVLLLLVKFVGDRDLQVWNNKRFVRSPPFTKLDETIVRFRRWNKQFYSKNSELN